MSKSNMNLKLVAGLLVASGSTAAVASMNNLNVQSHLGERFNGTIVVTGPTAQEILKSPSSVKVSGAPISARVSKQGTAAVIHLRSKTPINDPVLRLSVQAGTQNRHYSAIIDPKDSVHQSAQVNAGKAIPAVPATAPDNAQVTSPEKPATAVTNKTDVATTGSEKPKTSIPTAEAKKPTVAMPRVNKRTIQNNRATTRQNSTPVSIANIETAEQYKVQPNDSIYEIASRFQPQGLSTAQTAKALMRANPQAFRNKNPNLLYGDATLNIPSDADMHTLATGRVPQKTTTKTNTPNSSKKVVAGATAASVTAGAAALVPADDVRAIQKQLADLEAQKKQLEQKLAQELAEAEAEKKAAAQAAINTEKQAKATAEAEKKAATEAEKKAAQTAEAQKKAAVETEQKAATQAASKPIASAPQATSAVAATSVASEPVVSAPIIASETTETASAPAASAAVTAPTKPSKKPKAPEPEPEPSLLDLIMQYLPYLAGGVVLLLLAAWLLKQRQKKSHSDDDPDGGAQGDNDDIQFNLDDANIDKKGDDDDNEKLTDAEWDALNALDAFPANDDMALHQATAQPTAAPTKDLGKQAAIGAAVVGTAAVAGAAYANNTPDDDFMPSAEELAQFGQPSVTAAPELDDFNLDDLDKLFQPSPAATSSLAAPATANNDFDLNELDSLLSQNGFDTPTPNAAENFASASEEDANLDFNLDEVLQNTESFSQPSAAPDFDFSVDIPTPTEQPVSASSFNEFDLDDFEKSLSLTKSNDSSLSDFDADDNFEASLLAAGSSKDSLSGLTIPDAASNNSAISVTADAGLTLSQEDINDINFDLNAFDVNNVLDTQAATVAPTSAPIADVGAATAASAAAISSHEQEQVNALDLAFDLDIPDGTTDATATPKAANVADDSDFDLGLDALFDTPQAAPVTPVNVTENTDNEFVSKFSSISLESEHNHLAFDDSFSGLNFDDLLKTDDLPNEAPLIEETASQALADFPELNVDSESTPSPEFSVHDFKDFSIDTPSKSNRPTQAWAGTGDFGIASETPVAEDIATSETLAEADDFDFGSLGLDETFDLDATAATTTATPEPNFNLDLDSLLSTDAPTLAANNAPTDLAESDLSFDDDFDLPDLAAFNDSNHTSAPLHATETHVTETEADLPLNSILSLDDEEPVASVAADTESSTDNLGFDLNLDNLDELHLGAEPSTQPAPTAKPDIVSPFAFNLDTTTLPQEAVATPEPEISESLSLDDFDLSFQTPDTQASAQSVSIALDEFDLDLDAPATTTATAAPDLSLDNFDLSLDEATDFSLDDFASSLDTDTPNPAIENNLSLDDFALSLDTDTEISSTQVDSSELALDDFDLSLDEIVANATANTENTNTDLSLDDFDLSLDEVVANAAASTPNTSADLSLDDFDLSLDETSPATASAENNLDFSLNDLESFDLSLDSNANPASAELTVDDFDLSLDSTSATNTDLQDANTILDMGITVEPVKTTDFELGFDSPLTDDNSIFNSSLFKPDSAILFDESVTQTNAPNIPAPLAMIETAPPIVDADAYLNSMDHTYSTKWDLAQMYLDLGDQEATREILIDLIENSSETYAQRAQALFNTL